MVTISLATKEDLQQLVSTCIRAFHADVLFTPPEIPPQGPPGYDSPEWNLNQIEQTIYYAIRKDRGVIGGIILFDMDRYADQKGVFNIGRIWVDPYYQNQGIGQEAMSQMFSTHPEVKKWRLGTPSFAGRNQHFYEKMGFLKIVETEVDPQLGWGSIEYEKIIS